jgi:hypothetical protein
VALVSFVVLHLFNIDVRITKIYSCVYGVSPRGYLYSLLLYLYLLVYLLITLGNSASSTSREFTIIANPKLKNNKKKN